MSLFLWKNIKKWYIYYIFSVIQLFLRKMHKTGGGTSMVYILLNRNDILWLYIFEWVYIISNSYIFYLYFGNFLELHEKMGSKILFWFSIKELYIFSYWLNYMKYNQSIYWVRKMFFFLRKMGNLWFPYLCCMNTVCFS
jgi:hypothetical protein